MSSLLCDRSGGNPLKQAVAQSPFPDCPVEAPLVFKHLDNPFHTIASVHLAAVVRCSGSVNIREGRRTSRSLSDFPEYQRLGPGTALRHDVRKNPRKIMKTAIPRRYANRLSRACFKDRMPLLISLRDGALPRSQSRSCFCSGTVSEGISLRKIILRRPA